MDSSVPPVVRITSNVRQQQFLATERTASCSALLWTTLFSVAVLFSSPASPGYHLWISSRGSEIPYPPHRITESFELEGTLKGCLVQLPCTEQGRPQLHQCSEPIQPDLGCLQGWGTTTFLVSLCHCLTALTVKKNKNLSLISNLNLPSFSLKPLPCPITTDSAKESVSSFLAALLKILTGCSQVFLKLSLPHAAQS